MKKNILVSMILVALFAMTGCTVIPVYEELDALIADGTITDTLSAKVYVESKIDYVDDYTQYGEDYWASPRETNNVLKGDCEDMVLEFMYLEFKATGVKWDLVGMTVQVDNQYFKHAVAKNPGTGEIYDPMGYVSTYTNPVNHPIPYRLWHRAFKTWSFDKSLTHASAYGTKSAIASSDGDLIVPMEDRVEFDDAALRAALGL